MIDYLDHDHLSEVSNLCTLVFDSWSLKIGTVGLHEKMKKLTDDFTFYFFT